MGTTTRNNIGRLNPDGTLDIASILGPTGSVEALAIQADGKIVVGGSFRTLGGGARKIHRPVETADGTLDTGFDPGADNFVLALAVQADGKILVGGYFFDHGRHAPAAMVSAESNPDGTAGPQASTPRQAAPSLLSRCKRTAGS